MDNAKFWWSSSATPQPPGPDVFGQSLRFRGSSRLIRTMASNSGGVYTWSAWIKRGDLSTGDQQIFGTVSPIQFHHIRSNNFGWTQASVTDNETAQRRDPAAWYHRVDTSDGTNIRMFINGELVETWTQGSVGVNTNVEHFIGGDSGRASEFFQGYLADVYFIDGQVLQPTAFASPNTEGVWIPREEADFDGVFGANGFHLDFADPNDLGADRSGNGNDFTPTGFNTTQPGIFTPRQAGSGPGEYQADPANRTMMLTNPDQAFDGNLFAQVQVGNTADSNDFGGWYYFTPNFTGVTRYMFNYHDPATPTNVRINGQEVNFTLGVSGPTTVFGANNWCDVEIPADGVLNEFAFTSAGAGTNTQVVGQLLNGDQLENLLVDNPGTDFDLVTDSPISNFSTHNPLLPLNENSETRDDICRAPAGALQISSWY